MSSCVTVSRDDSSRSWLSDMGSLGFLFLLPFGLPGGRLPVGARKVGNFHPNYGITNGMEERVIPVTGPDQIAKMIAAGAELFEFQPWDAVPENFMELSSEVSEEDDGPATPLPQPATS